MEGLEIALGARPAREISGDIYDFFDCDKCGSLICFGDSSGKSAAAALYGALVSGLLRSLAGVCQRPADLMAHLNETLLERRVETKYVTMLLMLWDAKQRSFSMTNAGNTPPMVIRGDKVFSIDVAGIPLGLLDDRAYDSRLSGRARRSRPAPLRRRGRPASPHRRGRRRGRRLRHQTHRKASRKSPHPARQRHHRGLLR